jgi:hypothetical protein
LTVPPLAGVAVTGGVAELGVAAGAAAGVSSVVESDVAVGASAGTVGESVVGVSTGMDAIAGAVTTGAGVACARTFGVGAYFSTVFRKTIESCGAGTCPLSNE